MLELLNTFLSPLLNSDTSINYLLPPQRLIKFWPFSPKFLHLCQLKANFVCNILVLRTTGNGTEVELPIFPRERLKLVTFLGSGAFGEVFEGLATDIHGNGTGDTRVAVKVG